MRIVLDNIEGEIYGDIILSPSEMERMRSGEMIDTYTALGSRRYYLGVRLKGVSEYVEEEDEIAKDY
ncbi:MAG TPA: hypothetical protein VIJ14_08120 [Rhabdochlamydiaceae bacterium]